MDEEPVNEAEAALKRDRLATLNRFIVETLMPEWEADGWWYEHDDDPPTVPGVQQGFLLERDDVRVLVTVALVEYDALPDPCMGARDLMADLEASLQRSPGAG